MAESSAPEADFMPSSIASLSLGSVSGSSNFFFTSASALFMACSSKKGKVGLVMTIGGVFPAGGGGGGGREVLSGSSLGEEKQGGGLERLGVGGQAAEREEEAAGGGEGTAEASCDRHNRACGSVAQGS
mmetsp:Transcript_3422/g.8318  ORF Transcript_3422/g.8318 Transcript_3422/m.8318 type:complete len:129 (-) Transcript_3422:3537-3923(-)